MNPYRVSTGYQRGEVPAGNPQNDPNNLLHGSTTILNPSLPHVKEHIYNTINEFAELYPTVDAVHFDDYFYINTDAEPTSANARRDHVTVLNGNCVTEGRGDAYEAIKNAVFTATTSGINCTIIGVRSGAILPSALTIPESLNSRTVTKIGDYAFEDNTTLTKVTIPLSVAYIGDHAFSNCTNLSQVEISDETTSILGSTPFSGCIQLYNTVVSIRTDYHRIIDDTGRLIWMAHDFVYDDNHSSTHHDLICVTCGFEDTKSHNKHVVNGIEVCSTCPWVGGAHVHHEHTHSYIPIPHSGKFPINLHKAYCFCGEYIEEMCLGRIAEDGKAYCIHCGRDMTGALGQIINRILLPESDFHDNDIYCIGDGHSNDCCIAKDGLFLSELKNVLYMDVKRRERSFYGGA